jgi:hypothetical protein
VYESYRSLDCTATEEMATEIQVCRHLGNHASVRGVSVRNGCRVILEMKAAAIGAS